jgi:hypothetical protein
MDGIINWEQGEGVSDQDFEKVKKAANDLMNSNTTAGKRYRELYNSKKIIVTIQVTSSKGSNASAENGHVDGNHENKKLSICFYVYFILDSSRDNMSEKC